MKPIENTFEEALILALPPVAQRVAYELFSTWSLPKLMAAWLNDEPDEALLKSEGCPARFWPDILRATFVARTTYFQPDPALTPEEANYLVRLACAHLGYPLNQYPLMEVLGASRQDYPVFHDWLSGFVKLLHGERAEVRGE